MIYTCKKATGKVQYGVDVDGRNCAEKGTALYQILSDKVQFSSSYQFNGNKVSFSQLIIPPRELRCQSPAGGYHTAIRVQRS